MKHQNTFRSAVLIGILLFLTACGGSSASTGSSSGSPGVAAPVVLPAQPTLTQAMICEAEVKGDIQTALGLSTPPVVTSSYSADLFSCTYRLAQGPMTLSVQHSATDADAVTYLQTQSRAVGATTAVAGLTDHAYSTGAGIVLTTKDDETLMVDTTHLPMVFGDQDQSRADFAYEVASIVLGCWTGHDS